MSRDSFPAADQETFEDDRHLQLGLHQRCAPYADACREEGTRVPGSPPVFFLSSWLGGRFFPGPRFLVLEFCKGGDVLDRVVADGVMDELSLLSMSWVEDEGLHR